MDTSRDRSFFESLFNILIDKGLTFGRYDQGKPNEQGEPSKIYTRIDGIDFFMKNDTEIHVKVEGVTLKLMRTDNETEISFTCPFPPTEEESIDVINRAKKALSKIDSFMNNHKK